MCNEKEENQHHIQCCTNKLASERRSEFAEILEDGLIGLKTHPDITTLLVRSMGVQANQNIMADIGGHANEEQLQLLIENQADIGWDKVRLGLWSTQWRSLQGKYMAEKGLRPVWAWARLAQLLVWAYVKGNWMYRNERVHGADRVERRDIHREGMRKKALVLFDERLLVGATG